MGQGTNFRGGVSITDVYMWKSDLKIGFKVLVYRLLHTRYVWSSVRIDFRLISRREVVVDGKEFHLP